MLLQTEDFRLYSAVEDKGLQAVQCSYKQRTSGCTVLLRTKDFRLYSAVEQRTSGCTVLLQTEDFRLYSAVVDKGPQAVQCC